MCLNSDNKYLLQMKLNLKIQNKKIVALEEFLFDAEVKDEVKELAEN